MKIFPCLLLLVVSAFPVLALDLPSNPPRGEKPVAAEISLMGTLEQRVAGGGETTGWVLRYAKDQRVDLLLPIDAFAWIRDGLAVGVKGRFETRRYPERGEIRVFVVREISQVVT